MKNLSFILSSLLITSMSSAQDEKSDSQPTTMPWYCEAKCISPSIMNAGTNPGSGKVDMTLPNQKVDGAVKGLKTASTGQKKIEVSGQANANVGCSGKNLCAAIGTSAVNAATNLNNIFKQEAQTLNSPNNVCTGRSFSNWACTGPNGEKADKSVITADDNAGAQPDIKKGRQ